MRTPSNFEDIPLGAFDTISLVNSAGIKAFLEKQQTTDAEGKRDQTAKVETNSELSAAILRAHRTSLNTISVEVRSLEQWIDDAAIYGNSNYFSPHDANQLGHFARVCAFVKRQGVSILEGKMSAPEEWVLACWIMKCWAFSLQVHLVNAEGAADDYEASLFLDSCSSIIRHTDSLLFSTKKSDSSFPSSRVPTYCIDFLREIFDRGWYSYDQSEYSDDDIHQILRGILDSKGAEKANPNVAAQAPSELDENKLDKTSSVRPVFEGALDRASIAEIVKRLREEQGLSQRKAAEISGLDKNDLWRVEAGTATLDLGVKVLMHLGYHVEFTVKTGPEEPFA